MDKPEKPARTFLTISEFGEKISATPASLRRWDKKGLLIPAERTLGGIARYSFAQVDEYFAKTRSTAPMVRANRELGAVLNDK